MNSITEFKSEFSRVMRGYSPSEVDEAVGMLVSYAAELEEANAEFAEANDAMAAQNDVLTAAQTELIAVRDAQQKELESLRAEAENYRSKIGDAKNLLAEAKRNAEEIRAAAEREAAQHRAAKLRETEEELARLREACRTEEARFAAISRRTAALTLAARNLCSEQLEAIDALESMIPADTVPEPAKPEPPKPEPAKPAAPTVRRTAMAAAALRGTDAEPVPAPQGEASAEQAGTMAFAPVKTVPTETAMETVEFAPVRDAQTDTAARADVRAAGVRVDAVYRPAEPTAMKITRAKDAAAPPTHSYSAVRRSLEEISAKLK